VIMADSQFKHIQNFRNSELTIAMKAWLSKYSEVKE